MAIKAGKSFHLFRCNFLILMSLLIVATSARAQNVTRPAARATDTVARPHVDTTGDLTIVSKDTVPTSHMQLRPPHSPRKAALYSAILPGLGQAYNREYWKMPLVYAAIGTCTYFFVFNLDKYHLYRDAYRLKVDGNPDTNISDPFLAARSEQYLKAYRDYYRQNIDYSVLFFVLAYGLNIADATVFAHLRNWDMSDELSMRVSPALINNRALGISVNISIGGSKKAKKNTWLAGR